MKLSPRWPPLTTRASRSRSRASLTPRLVATTAALVAILLGGTYFATKELNTVAKPHDPVSVVIADFDNRTAIRPSIARSSRC